MMVLRSMPNLSVARDPYWRIKTTHMELTFSFSSLKSPYNLNTIPNNTMLDIRDDMFIVGSNFMTDQPLRCGESLSRNGLVA